MGRVVTSQNINISESSRVKENAFAEQIPSSTIGPVVNQSSQGDGISTTTPAPSQINKWKVMTVGDDGLKQALYDWINTTKDGTKLSPNILSGRNKVLTFNFYGNIGKSIAPGEIGEFNLIFSYPPTTVAAPNNTQQS